MLEITFFKRTYLYGFEASGHASFAVEGEDIVCAAASALLQSTLLGLKKILKISGRTKIKKGYLLFILNEGLSQVKIEKSQLLLETLYESLKEIKKQYPKYIKIKTRRHNGRL
ncbi:MAG: ribosomal-processing cysteine protease Prp [Armatimonadota bacterium]